MQQPEEQPESIRSELLDRLRALEQPQSSGALGELAYRRAREALESALEEARSIRLQAIEDARATRERELNSLMQSMRALREAAAQQIETLLRTAEIEAARTRERGAYEAETLLESTRREAAGIREEATALRTAAEARLREVERIESEFDRAAADLATRLGITDKPAEGWWRRLSDKR